MLKNNLITICLNKFSSKGLSARKYLRSISQSALLYRPSNLSQFSQEQSINDRVVQQFFNTTSLKHRIQVFQSSNRLQKIQQTSTPNHSYYKFILPFKQNDNLRYKMVQFYTNNVRVGRVLQLMDYIAANVAYRYCSQSNYSNSIKDLPFIAVTASIDQIDFFHPILSDINCSFQGYVSYAGNSSMQIQIVVTQIVQNVQRLACSAKFVMVARDKVTGKSYKVPKLDINNQPQMLRIRSQLGNKRQKQRKIQATKSLSISPPTHQQSAQVHKMLINMKNQNQSQMVQINKTQMKNSILMHLQDKNLSGKIFGGYIMRLSYQLGWLTGHQFLGGKHPICSYIDDVQFLAPVQIGSVIQMRARVGMVDEQFMHIVVQVTNHQAGGNSHLTNILRLTFQHCGTNKRVYPKTLAQSNLYIQSCRRIKQYIKK